jgi:hypothetical protein
MASFLVEEGCRAWSVGCQICRSFVIAATTNDGPFLTPFGLFSGPEDNRNNNPGSCLTLMGAPSTFGGPHASAMA